MLDWRAKFNLNSIAYLIFVVWLVLAAADVRNGEPKRSLRLPNTTYPVHYYLHIISRVHEHDLLYHGNVTIEIIVAESTNEIVLHAKNLKYSNINVHDILTGERFDDLTHTCDENFLIIHPIENYQAFEAGQHLRVEIIFSNVMNEKTFGIYWFTYDDENNEPVYLVATQFEPTSARSGFPCYDEPKFKANFSIRLTHSSMYSAISNMPLKDIHPYNENDWNTRSRNNLVTTAFHTTPPMSTYLVAFVISNFEYISEHYRGTTQRIYTAPTVKDKGYEALKNAVRTVAAIEDYFGISYPLPKLDHIALQKNYGSAMENWGLITYKEDNLVHQEESDVHKTLKDILTQNHEIAHQWFGNLVSPEWWSFVWLNEGFATYFSYIITDLLYPESNTMDFFLTDIAERAYSYGYMAVRPMTYYVETEKEISSIFDIITYQRAACVIKMFHHAFNQKTFVRGISKFLSKYQYMATNELQLFDALQSAVSEDITINQQKWATSVEEIMLSWTHSEWIPVVTIIYNVENDTITIRQRSKDIKSSEHWWIPLNFASASDPDFENTQVDYFMPPIPEVRLNIDELNIKFHANDWLIVNKMQTGFYHVLYDDRNLRKIAWQLQKNHTVIHPLNRASIFQDLCSLIENNEIQNVNIIFELLKYLQYEEDLIPWNNVADTIKFLEKNLYATASHKLYKKFIHKLVTPMFHKLFDTIHHTNLTSTEMIARQKILDIACMADVPSCLNFTHTLAHEYIFNHVQFENDMNYYAMHDSIMCLGVKYLTDEEFNAILEMLSKSDSNSTWYDDLIYALRCTESRDHLRQFLDLLFGENSTHSIMDDSDSMMYAFFLYKSSMAARSVVWHFFERNYKLLCHSEYFVENFNRIAEYIPQRHRSAFIKLHDDVAAELQAPENNYRRRLIEIDSQRIGKKVRISEMFLEKFSDDIHNWLLQEQTESPAYAASVSVPSNANRMMPLHGLGNMISELLYF